jgi:DHA1 family bicyclomycin/chloramphenicol resistance-like MFS transporter
METKRAGDGRSKSRLLTGIVLGTATAIGPFSIDMYLPALPDMAAEYGTNAAWTQLTLTMFLLGMALGQIVAGPISDAWGRRKPLFIGLAVYIAASLLCAIAPSIEGLAALRLLQGLAGASGVVIARAIARDRFEGVELTKFFALLTLIGGAGPIVAPIVGGQLLLLTSWHGVFVFLAAFGLLLWASMFLAIPESLPRERRIAGGVGTSALAMFGLLRDRELIGFAVTQGLAQAGLFSYISSSSFLMQDHYGVSPQTFSLLFAVCGSAFILGSQGTARLVGRYSERTLLLAGLTVSAASGLYLLAALAIGANLAFVVPALFALVACMGVIGTTCTSLALQKHKQAAGSAAGLLGLVGMSAGALISPLTGLGGGETVLPIGIVIAACNVLALLCCALLVRRSTSR